jgi:hypothetical protein
MGEDIMIIDDIRIRRMVGKDIGQLFNMVKMSLVEKGIENIRDDILMTQLKNDMSRRIESFNFGLYKMNTLIGFVFLDVGARFYDDSGFAIIDSIFLLPEFRTPENYRKLLNPVSKLIDDLDIKDVKTSDNWTLCNDCEVFKETIAMMAEPQTLYRIKR